MRFDLLLLPAGTPLLPRNMYGSAEVYVYCLIDDSDYVLLDPRAGKATAYVGECKRS